MQVQITGKDKSSRLPTPSLRLWVDEPKGRVLRGCECQFSAWGVSPRRGILERIVFRTSSGPLNFRNVERSDVNKAYPQMYVMGFLGTLSLSNHITAVKDGRLRIWVLSGKKIVARFHLQVAPGVIGLAAQQSTGC